MPNYLDPAGDVSDASGLKGRLSTQLWDFLSRGLNSYARAVEVRTTSVGLETVVFDVDVEVSQIRVHDIRPIERLSVTFWGETLPEILALRADFPFVPHVNPRPSEFPRSLCIYEESFEEIVLRWTPAAFIERLRWWLSETSKGTLHGADQPLEPLLIDHFATIVLPADLFTKLQEGSAQRLFISEITANAVYRASWQPSSMIAVAATVFECQPHVHGIIRWRPSSLGDLAGQLQQVGTDFISALRIRVRELHQHGVPLSAHLFLIIVLPKQRVASGAVEKTELWAFALGKTISDIGEAVGLWQMEGGAAGYLLGGSAKADSLENIPIDILNPAFELTRDGAAVLNGYLPSAMKVSAIGMGALGSQVTTHLIRSGFGLWTGLDPDFLLPHNVARHELTASDVGRSKLAAMQNRANSILAEPAMTAVIEANVVNPGERANEVRAAFENADVILDFSASLAVGRMLAHDCGVTRRCSVFLNPTGSDLVILCEDAQRHLRLDSLEFQYYRAVIAEPALAIHLTPPQEKVRYARSCRDLTSRVPQHLVAIHSGIAASALRRILAADAPFIGIWASDKQLQVRYFEPEPAPVQQFHVNGWTIRIDEFFLKRIAELRAQKRRKETGGILIGVCDQRHRVIYLVDTIASPPDSEEWPTLYIRGCAGLKESLDLVSNRSDGQLQYIGEWHSHPDGYSTDPSEDDTKVFAWLTDLMSRDGSPPLMLTAGEKDFRFVVEQIESFVQIPNPGSKNPALPHGRRS